ncbi:MAG: uroporphyrinogen decarboxylase family protein [bacterium]
MTGKERFITALKLGEPDAVPIWELAINEPCIINIAKHFTDNVPELKWLHEMTPNDLIAIFNALAMVVDELDFDGVTMPLLTGTEYLGNNIIRDSLGVLHYISSHGMPVPFEGPINSMDDLRTCKMPKPDDMWILAVQLAKDYFKDRKAAVLMSFDPFDLSWSLRGKMQNLLTDYITHPELAHGVARIATDLCIELASLAIDAGVDTIISPGDLAMDQSTLMSAAHFREFVKPYLKELVDAVHSRGCLIVKHSDGNLLPILDDLIEVGFDGVHPIQPQSMDIGKVKEHCKGKTCVLGNIDCRFLLTSGSVEEVEQSVKDTIRAAAPGGGYILSSSNTIHPDVKPENAIAMYRAARKYGKYPITELVRI